MLVVWYVLALYLFIYYLFIYSLFTFYRYYGVSIIFANVEPISKQRLVKAGWHSTCGKGVVMHVSVYKGYTFKDIS